MSADLDVATDRFEPPPGLGHAHLQSMLSSWSLRGRLLKARAAALTSAVSAELLDCGDGVRLLGYLSAQPDAPRGLAVLLHGWEGCADANYVVSLGAQLYARGFDVFRLNFRDHGGTQALNEELFHSCRITEVVNAIGALQRAHPRERNVLIGFSLGGNFALRAAARAAEAKLRLDRVFAICPVLRPHATMRALEEGLWVYRHYFLRRWRRSLRAKAASFPERYAFGDLRRFPTLTATTEFFVEHYTEFADLDSYLHGYAITGPVLAGLSVPCELIAALDDPVIPSRDLADVAHSPALRFRISEHGGHCGFLDSYRLHSWVDRQILAALELSPPTPRRDAAVFPETSSVSRRS